VISNPVRYESRVRLFRETMAHLELAGVTLYVVEAVFGDRAQSSIPTTLATTRSAAITRSG
jgi:hypothetical protein